MSAFAILAAIYCLVVAPIAVALGPPDSPFAKRARRKARIRESEGDGRQGDADASAQRSSTRPL
jgi:hypothetical protein